MFSKAPLHVKAHLAQSSEGWHFRFFSPPLFLPMRGDQLFRKEHCGWGSAHHKDFKDLPFPRMTRLGPEGGQREKKARGRETNGGGIFRCSSMASLDHPERPSNSSDLTTGFNNAITEVSVKFNFFHSR